jgi:hypothetical protein
MLDLAAGTAVAPVAGAGRTKIDQDRLSGLICFYAIHIVPRERRFHGRTTERDGRTECAGLGGIYRALRGARSAIRHPRGVLTFLPVRSLFDSAKPAFAESRFGSIRRSRPRCSLFAVRFGILDWPNMWPCLWATTGRVRT